MKVLTNNQYYSDIADTIRQMKGVATTYKPREMAGALREMYSTEVEGVPPLTFPSNENNLLNYRIDGASGGVGDRTKNLLQNTATSQTISGVTFTVNSDGSVTCNGTASSNAIFAISVKLNANINYILNGTPENGGVETYRIDLRTASYSVYNNIIDNGNGAIFTVQENGTYLVSIRIASNYNCNNLTFYPMIRLATIEDDTYEPYGYKIPVVISGKNLWNEDYTDIPVNMPLYKPLYLGEGTFTLSTSAPLNSNNAANLFLMSGNVTQGASTNTTGCWNGHPITAIANNGYVTIAFRSQYNVNPADYQSQIELGSQATNYEPYIEPTTTNIYLDEPIEANESKSLSDTNVNIPTINGTNILSIDTTIQPSNVYVQAPKNNSYNI